MYPLGGVEIGVFFLGLHIMHWSALYTLLIIVFNRVILLILIWYLFFCLSTIYFCGQNLWTSFYCVTFYYRPALKLSWVTKILQIIMPHIFIQAMVSHILWTASWESFILNCMLSKYDCSCVNVLTHWHTSFLNIAY